MDFADGGMSVFEWYIGSAYQYTPFACSDNLPTSDEQPQRLAVQKYLPDLGIGTATEGENGFS